VAVECMRECCEVAEGVGCEVWARCRPEWKAIPASMLVLHILGGVGRE
jgi:hypothetical protein